jgi:hypothetical protein
MTDGKPFFIMQIKEKNEFIIIFFFYYISLIKQQAIMIKP